MKYKVVYKHVYENPENRYQELVNQENFALRIKDIMMKHGCEVNGCIIYIPVGTRYTNALVNITRKYLTGIKGYYDYREHTFDPWEYRGENDTNTWYLCDYSNWSVSRMLDHYCE